MVLLYLYRISLREFIFHNISKMAPLLHAETHGITGGQTASAVFFPGSFGQNQSMPTHHPTRDDLLQRYRAYRQAIQQHLNAALNYAKAAAFQQAARRIGMMSVGTIVADNLSEMNLVYDLAVFGQEPGQSRVIDRYARATRFAKNSVEAETLAALRHSRFHLLQSLHRHDCAGTVALDRFRNGELWVLDEGLEITWKEGALLATRLIPLGAFSTTAGAMVPINQDVIDQALKSRQSWRQDPDRIDPDDPHLPEAVYAAAIAHGTLQYIAYRDDH
jgi:hypothetical protein